MGPLALLLAVAALLVGADAFNTRGGLIYPIAPADRLSDTQLFARDVDIQNWSGSVPYVNLYVHVPGRVYVTYAENPTSSNIIFGKIKISGSTEGAVDYVKFDIFMPDADIVTLSTRMFDHNASETDWLLVEIELYQKNSLKKLDYMGDGDLVILDDMIYAPTKLPADDRSGLGSYIELGPSNGSVFVVDPKAEFTTDFFDIENNSEDTHASVQMELAALNSTIGNIDIDLSSLNNVTLFIDRLGDVDMFFMDSASQQRNGLCIAAKNDVNVSERVMDQRNTSSHVVPRGSSCVKLPIPGKVPAQIGGGIGVRKSETETNVPSIPSDASSWLPAALVGGLTTAVALLIQ